MQTPHRKILANQQDQIQSHFAVLWQSILAHLAAPNNGYMYQNMNISSVMDWRPVQGVHRLSNDDRWDRLQPPATRPTD